MQVVHPRCCGLDVHQKSVTACVLCADGHGQPTKEVRTFAPMTVDRLALADWLTGHEVTAVAMERTGVSWKPVWNVLEGDVTLLLVNAQHVKQGPGRTTDVKDAEWIADLLRHGLLRPSFVPDQPQRELRELTRRRTQRVRARAAEINRLHQTLEAANIKLGAVARDLLGVSCREMLAELLAGRDDPAALAQLARGRMRPKLAAVEQALAGRFAAHHRFLVAEHLATIDELEAGIERLSEAIATRLAPPVPPDAPAAAARREVKLLPATADAPAVVVDRATGEVLGAADLAADPLARLDTIPGVGRRVAEAILAELGTDMSRFPTAGHAAAWAGLGPGHDESAGKRRSGKTTKSTPWLRTILVEAAYAASRTKDTSLAARFRRLAARRGTKRAAVAVAHSILTIAYRLLKDGTIDQDLGGNYFDERDRQAVERRLVKRLEQLGHRVTLTPQAA